MSIFVIMCVSLNGGGTRGFSGTGVNFPGGREKEGDK